MAGTSEQVGDADCRLAIGIEEMLRTVAPLPTECCIYKVPEILRSENEAAYTPKVVSIGPLHHGEEKLKPMEAHKKRYLDAFLRRNPDITLEECVRFLRGLEERTRQNYYEDQFIQSFSSDEFVTMMLLDGCFIVELFLLRPSNVQGRNKYDPMFKSLPFFTSVFSDLMLLENQLPFFLLEQLFDFINGHNKVCMRYSFIELTVVNFVQYVRVDQTLHLRSSRYKAKHFVHYILICYLPSEASKMSSNRNRKTIYLPSATELQKSGIKFKKSTSHCYLDIKFANGVLDIPTILVEDGTEHIFRNLIAMEQCHEGSTLFITDYMVIMDFLINTPNDVALLRSHAIIENFVGSDEEVCRLFNGLRKGVSRDITESHYYRLLEDVSAYYNTEWNAWKAKLRRNYFTSPWAIISLNAAIVLLVCTLIQAVCSIISVKK